MVAGTTGSPPSAMLLRTLRRVLPDRVLGSAATTSTCLIPVTAPIWSRTSCTSSAHNRAR